MARGLYAIALALVMSACSKKDGDKPPIMPILLGTSASQDFTSVAKLRAENSIRDGLNADRLPTEQERIQHPLESTSIILQEALVPAERIMRCYKLNDLRELLNEQVVNYAIPDGKFNRAFKSVQATGRAHVFSHEGYVSDDPETTHFEYGVLLRPDNSMLAVARYKLSPETNIDKFNLTLEQNGLEPVRDHRVGYHTIHAVEISADGTIKAYSNPDALSLRAFGVSNNLTQGLPRDPIPATAGKPVLQFKPASP